MMLSINHVFSSGTRMRCRGLVLRNAYEDILALFKLKRKEQCQEEQSNDFAAENHQDYYNDHHHMSDLQLVPYVELLQPSAPPIPDSPNIGTKADLLAYFEAHEEQVDFRGRGLVDIIYVPFLEQVCDIHPCLLECQRKRTEEYSSWAFTALGRVLHFLETTKVAEMVDDVACECLQMLWDEVQVFGFDLSWLKPRVEFALKMKGYMERMRKLNKLEDQKRSIEQRIEELSFELVETEKEIESSKDDLELDQKVDPEMVFGYQIIDAAPTIIF